MVQETSLSWLHDSAATSSGQALDGELFASTRFLVETLGEPFIRDLEAAFEVDDLPEAGDQLTLEWQQSYQRLVMVDF